MRSLILLNIIETTTISAGITSNNDIVLINWTMGKTSIKISDCDWDKLNLSSLNVSKLNGISANANKTPIQIEISL